jgi:type VI secretion system protein ImpA
LDIDALITPLGDEQPAGEDLEYDPEFGELERTAQGTPEKRTGDAVIEAVPPDWREVRDKALALFDRTRDLRVAVHLTNALLHLEGFSGMRDGLQLCLQLSQTFWDTVYPQLDEDDGDVTIRANAVRELANRERLLRYVLDTPFVAARVAGSFTLRDLKVIAGELHPREGDDRPVPQPALIEAAFREMEVAEVETIAQVLADCIGAAQAIEAFYTSQVGAVDAPDLGLLTAELQQIHKHVMAEMSKLGLGEQTQAEGESADAGGSGSAPAAAAGHGQPISGDVRSREDVLRLIDKICFYYQQQEPSSPVPILLKRAASLVNKSFMEIVADLTPSGVSEAQRYAPSQSADWSASPDEGQQVESSDDSW